ncbi:MAG TPA: glutathione peroxidase [Leucothrix mucor]|nr:glutathione peroxidase [Leucothrix mucor]
MSLENKEGQKIPNVTFHTRQNNEWVDVTTDELFNGKTVIVFSLPGAFTPTCSSAHVPRYNQLLTTFKANGVDEIICMSVNDTFVMNEWQADQGANDITFMPDGNGEFSEGMGMLVDKDDLGFGKRSWRYSMLVKDGVVDKMFIEADVEGDPFDVSDADTMLNYIAADAKIPASVTVMARKGCPFCAKAKKMLDDAGMEYEVLMMGDDYTDRSLRAIVGSSSVPQVFINGDHVGGSTDLADWLKT